MFTGIIQALGTISALENKGSDIRLTVESAGLNMADVKMGDSIATNGVCLTVVDFSDSHYQADVSSETVKHTGFAEYKAGTRVNLELAMRPMDRFGGHIVSGHVDGTGKVTRIAEHKDYIEVWIKAPDELAKYIAHKGSITVDGVSLTVNEVNGAEFMLWIIPHTLKETVIGEYGIGTRVNLEVDLIARYLERLLLGEKASQTTASGINMAFLAEHGFLKK
ncbi:riboflavin synthase [Alteromonas ponticola]|uniref:Riboflavin synthase n=1 Tax=Alteromonas aquimaris TaxID=2998417 RepID=A0ABT3P3Q6_9ALTE|nr:riboflavin synthase [Alteromonas aquimaris]MCW8107405.1 riboflavin synthase [Alteromonas aquimaris]